VAVSKLSIPFSEKLISPKMIDKDNWIKYGINKENIIQYNALDPWAWLKDFNPDHKILEKIGVNENFPIVTVRLAEEYASYLLGNKSEKNISIEKLTEKLTSENNDIQVVIIPRYLDQIEKYKEIQNNKIIIMDSIVDGPSLLYYSDVFIGAGGTMSAEAALLGIPTLSCFPGKSYIIEQYLIEKSLIKRVTNIEILVKKIHDILKKSKEIRMENEKKVHYVVNEYEDPIKIISDEIEKLRSF
jgi:predicted glycosyltransferase